MAILSSDKEIFRSRIIAPLSIKKNVDVEGWNYIPASESKMKIFFSSMLTHNSEILAKAKIPFDDCLLLSYLVRLFFVLFRFLFLSVWIGP